MYRSYYNLTEKPFQLSSNPEFLWLGDKHKEALAFMKYGIIQNMGFVLLTGDVGTGKTTLISVLVKSLGYDTVVATVSDPRLEVSEFFSYLAKAFKIRESFRGKLEFRNVFSKFLEKACINDKRVVLIIDEAHKLSIELVEEIRLLSNIEIRNRLVLNIFLVGQNELNNVLMKPQCKAIRQRITMRHQLETLTESETGEYIDFRLKVAGNKTTIFTKDAMHEIYNFTRGYPRLINIICDQALLRGYVTESKTIGPATIKECAKRRSLPGETTVDMIHEEPLPKRQTKDLARRVAIYVPLLALIIILGYQFKAMGSGDYLLKFRNYYEQIFGRAEPGETEHTAAKGRVDSRDEPTAHSLHAQQQGQKENAGLNSEGLSRREPPSLGNSETDSLRGRHDERAVTLPYAKAEVGDGTSKQGSGDAIGHEHSTEKHLGAEVQGKSTNAQTLLSPDSQDEARKGSSRPGSEGVSGVIARAEPERPKPVEREQKPFRFRDLKLIVPLSNNSYELPARAYFMLDNLAAVTIKNPDVEIVVKVFYSPLGDLERSEKMSNYQASAVKRYLVKKNVNSARIRTMVLFEEHAAGPNTTRKSQDGSRRLEIALEPLGGG